MTPQPAPHRRKRFPIRVNCPHCRNPIAVVDEGTEDDVICPTCGSSFRLDRDQTLSWRPKKLPRLGKFELLEAVGRGAFGTVYRARDTELDRLVAVKVPRSGTFATKEDEDRFIREARSVAQLHHPAIVPVYEVGHGESFPYIVTKYIDGITLSDALTGRRFAFQESAEIIAQVAEALEHSHRQGVIHRDLKPSNIMLEKAEGGASRAESQRGTSTVKDEPTRTTDTRVVPPSGSGASTLDFRVRLMDFGLARREEGEITVTVDGQVLGTPAYMSPEQARGESHRVDGRSDVYSLGVILYELLAGELPFRGNSRMLLHQVLNAEPQSLRKLNDRIPRDLETICLKCMAKDRGQRYPTAQALADELRRFLRGEPIQARPITSIARTWRWCKRNPLGATIVALLLFLSVAGPTMAIRQQTLRNEALELADEKRRLAVANSDLAARERLARQRAEKRKSEALAARDEAVRQLRIATAQRLGLQARDALTEFPQRSLLLAAEAVEMSLRHHEPPVPIAEQALRDALGRIGGTPLTMPNDWVSPPVVSENGRWLAIGSGRQVCLWELTSSASGAILKTSTVQRWPVRSVALSADSCWLAACGIDDRVRLWNLEEPDLAGPVRELVLPGTNLDHVHLSRDGKWLIGGGPSRPSGPSRKQSQNEERTIIGLWSWKNPPDEKPIMVLECEQSRGGKLFVSAGGRWLCATLPLVLWDLHAPVVAESKRVMKSPAGVIVSATVSADDRWLATAADRGKRLCVYDLGHIEADTEPVWHFPLTQQISTLAITADSRLVLAGTSEGSVRSWELLAEEPASTVRRLPAHQAGISSIAASPDSQWLATAQGDKTVRLWSRQENSFRLADVLHGHDAAVEHLVFTHDSRWLVTSGKEPVARIWDMTRKFHASDPIVFDRPGAVLGYDSKHQRVIARTDEGLVAWQIPQEGGRPSRTVSLHVGSKIAATAVSGDGSMLAVGLPDGSIRVWDLSQAKPHPQDIAFSEGDLHQTVTALSLDRQGKRLFAGTDKGLLIAWDLLNGRPAGERLRGEGFEAIRWLVASQTGQWLVFASAEPRLRVLHVPKREVRYEASFAPNMEVVAFSPDERLLVIGESILDLSQQGPLQPRGKGIRHGMYGVIVSARVSPHSRWLATTGTTTSYDVKLWDLQSQDPGAAAIVLNGHRSSIETTDFDPDVHLLASGSFDGTVRIWNLMAPSPGLQPIVLGCGSEPVRKVHFSRDGRWLVAQASRIRVWNRDLRAMVSLARRLAGRPLTNQERLLYLDEKPVQEPRITGGFF